MPYLQSAALAFVSYDPNQETLTATFRDTRRTYVYEGVPQQLYDRMLFTDSIGAFFNGHIRDRFRYRDA